MTQSHCPGLSPQPSQDLFPSPCVGTAVIVCARGCALVTISTTLPTQEHL